MVAGVTDGFKKDLEIQGVGYRAQWMEASRPAVGYSHPVRMTPPDGVSYALDGNTRLSVTGIDKQFVGEEAARIRRSVRPSPTRARASATPASKFAARRERPVRPSNKCRAVEPPRSR